MAAHSAALFDALGDAQGIGLLGTRDLVEVVAQADQVVDALVDVRGRVVDLGSGGGVPGLVIADARPDLHLVLVDRREKRTDFLHRVVRRLGWSDRVEVVCADVDPWGQGPGAARFAAAVSRGFGPAETTLRLSRRCVRPGGLIVLTEPPAHLGDRWADVDTTGLDRLSPVGAPVVVFRSGGGVDEVDPAASRP